MEPGPKSVPTYTVSLSFQLMDDLPSDSMKPSGSHFLAARSNSRTTLASLPPRERLTRQRSYVGYRHAAPRQTQLAFSARLSASTSMRISHAGLAFTYSASVVRRHSPRGFTSSVQKL